MIAAPTLPPRAPVPPLALDTPEPVPAGTPVGVRWAIAGGGTEMCPGLFLAFVPAVDTHYRVLVRAVSPTGRHVLVEAHPDSIDFTWGAQCS